MPSKFSNFRIRAINCLGSSEPTYEICANQPVVGIPHNFTDINKITIDPEEIVHFQQKCNDVVNRKENAEKINMIY